MNSKTPIILMALLLVVGGVFYFIKDPKAAEPRHADQKGKPLLSLRADAVNSLTITPQGATPIELSRAGFSWKMSSPVQWHGDSAAIGALINDLIDIRIVGELESGQAAAGLDHPRVAIEFADYDGKSSRLAIGDSAPAGVYAKVDDGPVLLVSVSEKLASDFSMPVPDLVTLLRDKKLLSIDTFSIQQVQIDRPGSRIFLEKKMDNPRQAAGWTMVSPETMPADTQVVDNLVSTLAGLSAESFVDADSISSGHFDRPRATIYLSQSAVAAGPATAPATRPTTLPQSVRIDIGAPESIDRGKAYVRISTPSVVAVATISADTVDQLAKSALITFRDRQLFDIPEQEVSSILIATQFPPATRPTDPAPAAPSQVYFEHKPSYLSVGVSPPRLVAAPAPGATTEPTTQQGLPKSDWLLKTGPGGKPISDAEQTKVETLLGAFHPFSVSKYLEPAAPTTQPVASYIVTINTIDHDGLAGKHVVSIVDPGGTSALQATAQGLRFELSREFLDKIQGNFVNKFPTVVPHSDGGGFPGLPQGMRIPGGPTE